MPIADQKLFVQQVTQENGALDPGMTGGTDRGYSFGIGQWNTWPVKSKRWLKLHPEQTELQWQIDTLAKSSCDLYKKYPGNTRRAIVHHNCPECAIHNAKPIGCSSVDSSRKMNGRWSCYYEDEVNRSEHAARFVLGTL